MYKRNGIDGWVKRNDRRDVDVEAVAYFADGRHRRVRLSNISYDGCQLVADEPPAIGARITLALPHMGEVKAQIRWRSLDGRCGARFILEESAPAERRQRIGL